MKVKIGPFKSWFGPYQLAQLIMFWAPKEKDEYGYETTAKRVHNFGEWLAHGYVEKEPEVGDMFELTENKPVTWIYKLLLWIDRKKKRKVKVHIDDYDIWNADVTLSYIILPMLKKIKEGKHGCPFVKDEDVPEHLRSTAARELTEEEKNFHAPDDNYEARWNWVLDEMIFAFDSLTGDNQDWEHEFFKKEPPLYLKKVSEDGTSEMIQSGPSKVDWEAYRAYQKRIENGFALFGKYYQALWT